MVVDVAVATSVVAISVVDASLAPVTVAVSVAEELLDVADVELVKASLVEVAIGMAVVSTVVSIDTLAPELSVVTPALKSTETIGLKKHAVVSMHAPGPSEYQGVMAVFIRIAAPRPGLPWLG